METVCSNLSYGLWNYHHICSVMDVPESRLFKWINVLARRDAFFYLSQNFRIDLQSFTEVQLQTLNLELKTKPEVY